MYVSGDSSLWLEIQSSILYPISLPLHSSLGWMADIEANIGTFLPYNLVLSLKAPFSSYLWLYGFEISEIATRYEVSPFVVNLCMCTCACVCVHVW